MRVSADGGEPTPVTTLEGGGKAWLRRWPAFLPDDRHFLYLVTSPVAAEAGIYVGSIGSSGATRLLASDTNAIYAPAGALLFIRDGTLLSQRFDATRLALQGGALPVAEHVGHDLFGLGAFSASATGVLTYRTDGAADRQLTCVDRAGRALETVGPPGSYLDASLSPDATRVAFVRRGQNGADDIWTLGLAGPTPAPSRLTFTVGSKNEPIWAHDGSRIFYASMQDGAPGIFEKSVTGTQTEQLLVRAARTIVPFDVSADGRFLLYFEDRGPATSYDVFALPLTGERTPFPVVQTPFADIEPHLSPDGRWVAYLSTSTGSAEVYVQPFPPSGARRQISTGGGRQPMWRRDGQELFFVSDERKFYAVEVRPGAFEFGTPQLLFDLHANVVNIRNSYAPSPDGQRFLVNMPLDTAPSPITVVLNWSAGLK